MDLRSRLTPGGQKKLLERMEKGSWVNAPATKILINAKENTHGEGLSFGRITIRLRRWGNKTTYRFISMHTCNWMPSSREIGKTKKEIAEKKLRPQTSRCDTQKNTKN